VRRLFLRLWVVALGLFVLGLLGQLAIAYTIWSDDEIGYWEGIYAPGLLVAADTVVDPEGREAALAAVAAHARTDAAVQQLDAIPDEARQQLADGHRLGWVHATAGEFYYAPASDGHTVLVVGPLPSYPLPSPGPRLLLAAALAVSLGLVFWLVLRPLDRSQRAIAAATRRIADGQLDARLSPEQTPAAPELAGAFNEMGDRIQALVGQQQRMLRVASHELRTPLARMRLGLHLLDGELGGEHPRAAAMDRNLDELEGLVEDILLHARLERSGAGRQVEFSPDEAVREVVEEQLLLSPAVDIVVALSEPPRLRASERLFRRALSNLLSNAVRYAESQVVVSSVVEQDSLLIVVDDDGPGIAASDHGAARRPFATLDERSRHGLGLSIVDGVMSAHGGEMVLLASPSGGLRVRLRWPVG